MDWKPIAELTETLKDGRQVLLWGRFGAEVGTWTTGRNGWGMPESGFFEVDGRPAIKPTLFAEITPPAPR